MTDVILGVAPMSYNDVVLTGYHYRYSLEFVLVQARRRCDGNLRGSGV